MNKLLNDTLKARNGHYCHALEVDTVEALKSCIEAIIDQNGDSYTAAEYVEFFKTMNVIACDDDHETDVYSFDVEGFINSYIW